MAGTCISNICSSNCSGSPGLYFYDDSCICTANSDCFSGFCDLDANQITASALQMQNVNQETVHPPMFVPQTAQALLTQTTANVLTILNANPHSALPTSANQSAVKSTL
mmetsp:Transcript_34333/g.25408  ORF Transcript_34333/g.25408 Transcript_34333/m.25408 type:complete len:109 (-) Transcript_34333:504-830(-)